MNNIQLPRFLLNIDMFGAPAPVLNLCKQNTVKTSIGAVMSMLIMFMTIIFALLKLQKMLLRERPDVVSFVDEAAFDSNMRYSLSDNDFMIAFSVES